MEKSVEVKGPRDPIVVVYRGVSRNTYSCTPECAPRITLGDDSDYFNKTLVRLRQPQHPGHVRRGNLRRARRRPRPAARRLRALVRKSSGR